MDLGGVSFTALETFIWHQLPSIGVVMKSTRTGTETAYLTGDILAEEYQAIHGGDLKQKYEQKKWVWVVGRIQNG
jgi:hypothetical protein